MSRSAWSCRHCGRPLGFLHHTGRLRPVAGATVFVDLGGRHGPFVRVVCPGCSRHRDYAAGRLVVRAQ